MVAEDSRLRCPECNYNLTGLTQSRCPECGSTFDWDEVRQARDRAPRIAFERARGWRKAGAFFATWATVLLTPWIFARQITVCFSVRNALFFGALCFLPVTARYVADGSGDWETYFPWVLTAVFYVLIQAALMIVVDPTGWREPRATFKFWLAVGGYTTAIVATECWQAAPVLMLSDVFGWVRRVAVTGEPFSELYNLMGFGYTWVCWLQVGLWLAGIMFCYWRRLRRRHVSTLVLVVVTPFVTLALLLLYAFCVEEVAANFLYEKVFDNLF